MSNPLIEDHVEHYQHPELKVDVKRTWSCKAIIVRKIASKIEILLSRDEHDDHMSIPWWTVKIGEPEAETLNRECREELKNPEFKLLSFTPFRETEKVFQGPTDNQYRHKVYMWFICSIGDDMSTGDGQFIEIRESLTLLKDFEKEVIEAYLDSIK